MSDCSTQKEPIDEEFGHVLCFGIKDSNDNMSQVTEVQVNDHRFIREQRYQRLEYVAKALQMSYSVLYKDALPKLGAFWMRNEFVSPEGTKAALKDLGVEIDD